jgi:DNA mismatch repair protein MutL
VLNTFLVCATDDGVLIVDQHSAHERINYERLRVQWEAHGRNPDVQPLMFPEALKLDVQRVALLKEMEPYLERLGFELSPAGPREMLVNAVPAALGEQSVSKALEALMDAYSEAREIGIKSGEVGGALTPVEDRLLMTMACHAAIKAGQPLAESEMRALWKDLVRVDLAAHDVHGRPAVLTLPGTEIARRMGRTL